jgi:uncharacterized protein (DUF4213/DUF364 family)
MSIIEEVLQSLPNDSVPVRRVLVGIHWTAVCSRFCGLASTLTGENLPYAHLQSAGNLQTRSARELADLALSENHYESSIGVAAINSLLASKSNCSTELNAYEWLYANIKDRDVAIVGHFPFIDRVRSMARNLWVLEKNPRPGDIPAEESQPYLQKAEIIAITGSSIVNHSFDDVLSMCNPRAVIMVLGPSTLLSPVLFDHGVSILSGAYVADEDECLLTLEQGGSFHQVQGVKRISLFKEGVK